MPKLVLLLISKQFKNHSVLQNNRILISKTTGESNVESKSSFQYSRQYLQLLYITITLKVINSSIFTAEFQSLGYIFLNTQCIFHNLTFLEQNMTIS